MTVNQDIVCVSWGAVIILFAVYCLFRVLFFKSCISRKKKKVMGVARRSSRSTDNDPYRYHLVPLGFQPDEDIFYQTNGNNLPESAPLPQAIEGFQGGDLTPPGDLLGIYLARKQQENIIANALNRRENDDYTPFLIACWDCNDTAIEAFIELGADTRQKTVAGETGLVLCTYRMARGKCPWNSRCLELLLQNGCPIDEVTKDNNTALHLAVKAGHVPATKWLLAHGATTDIANFKGWRPIAIAQAKGRKDLVQLLWDCDPEVNEEETGNGRSSSYHSANAE